MTSKNDGKYLEDAVEKELKKNDLSKLHWRRLHDAGAAKRTIEAQPSDFFICYLDEGVASPTHLECKSRAGKTLRLAMFDQHPAMTRWSKAGVRGLVLVHWHELDSFSLVDIAAIPPGVPSWKLGSFPIYMSFDRVFNALMKAIKE